MPAKPTLYVCHGDKVVAAHGNPIPFLRKGSRDELRAATGDDKLPTLKLPDGTVLRHSRAILAWVAEQQQPSAAQTPPAA